MSGSNKFWGGMVLIGVIAIMFLRLGPWGGPEEDHEGDGSAPGPRGSQERESPVLEGFVLASFLVADDEGESPFGFGRIRLSQANDGVHPVGGGVSRFDLFYCEEQCPGEIFRATDSGMEFLVDSEVAGRFPFQVHEITFSKVLSLGHWNWVTATITGSLDEGDETDSFSCAGFLRTQECPLQDWPQLPQEFFIGPEMELNLDGLGDALATAIAFGLMGGLVSMMGQDPEIKNMKGFPQLLLDGGTKVGKSLPQEIQDSALDAGGYCYLYVVLEEMEPYAALMQMKERIHQTPSSQSATEDPCVWIYFQSLRSEELFREQIAAGGFDLRFIRDVSPKWQPSLFDHTCLLTFNSMGAAVWEAH